MLMRRLQTVVHTQVPKAAVLDRLAPGSNGQTSAAEAAKPQPALDFDQQLPDMSKASLPGPAC